MSSDKRVTYVSDTAGHWALGIGHWTRHGNVLNTGNVSLSISAVSQSVTAASA